MNHKLTRDSRLRFAKLVLRTAGPSLSIHGPEAHRVQKFLGLDVFHFGPGHCGFLLCFRIYFHFHVGGKQGDSTDMNQS